MEALSLSEDKRSTLKTPLKLAWLCVVRNKSSYDQMCPKSRIIKRMGHDTENNSTLAEGICKLDLNTCCVVSSCVIY